MKKRLGLFFVVGVLAVASAIGGWFTFSSDDKSELSSPTRILFEQPFKNPDQQVVDLSPLRNHVLIVNFWATWCAPCIKEMPELSDLQDEYAGQKIQVLGLAIDGFDNVREFGKRLTVNYPLLVLGASGIELARQFGNESGALPFTIVVSPSGQIIDRTVGIVSIEHLREVIAAAQTQ